MRLQCCRATVSRTQDEDRYQAVVPDNKHATSYRVDVQVRHFFSSTNQAFTPVGGGGGGALDDCAIIFLNHPETSWYASHQRTSLLAIFTSPFTCATLPCSWNTGSRRDATPTYPRSFIGIFKTSRITSSACVSWIFPYALLLQGTDRPQRLDRAIKS